jgi:microcystin-dependent protein
MSSETSRLGLKQIDTTDYVSEIRGAIGTNAAVLNAAVLYDEGPLAQRPTASLAQPYIAGAEYRALDDTTGGGPHGTLYKCYGTGWAPVVEGLGLPPGALMPFAGATAPSGFLLCDGSAVSRSDYSRLFAAIGTTFGSGNGTSTFNLPDLRGRVPVGVDGAAGRMSDNDALGQSGGQERVTLTTQQIPAHTHTYQRGKADAPAGAGGGGAFADWSQESAVTGSAGGGQPHENRQPYLVVNYIIKT